MSTKNPSAEGSADASIENLTLLCTHHHRCLHEGGFRIEHGAKGELRFRRADGRTIPRFGYRVEDFTDDDFRADYENPSAEGFRSAGPQNTVAEVREPRAVYRVAPRHGRRLQAFASTR